MNTELSRALSQTSQVIHFSNKEIQDKIPESFKQFIEKNKSLEEKYESKTELLRNLTKQTKGMLALIYRDYLCTKEEREKLVIQELELRRKTEKEKQEKYGVEIDLKKIAEKRRRKDNIEKLETEISLMEIPKEKWYQRIIHKLLEIFKRK